MSIHYTTRVLVAALLVSVGGRASAHHSFSATYLEDREITVQGDLAAFMLRNPHSFVHLLVEDEHGVVQRYRLRMRRISRPRDGWEWSGNFD